MTITSRSKIHRLTLSAMMGALSFLLMYFSFSVPFISPFAEFDFSALPELIGGFILGPLGAVEIIVVKLLLKLVFRAALSAYRRAAKSDFELDLRAPRCSVLSQA